MATSPDTDVRDRIATLGAWTTDTNLFAGKVRAPGSVIPQEAVFCLASGGPGSMAYADGTTLEERMSAVQVIVRSNPGDFEGGQANARAVKNVVHHAPIAGYIDVAATQEEPIYMHEEEDELHLWSINFLLTHEE